jgi:hypothetical protein
VSIVACKARPSRVEVDTQWTRDSATYAATLNKWLRDSAVIDSLSRLVNTDSLYRLYRRMLVPTTDSGAVLNAIACEGERLGVRHGSLPSRDAIDRMLDTLWQGLDPKRIEVLEAYPGRPIIVSTATGCPITGPEAPREVAGTSLDTRRTDRPIELPRRRRPPSA